ncbi:MAG: MarR family transcriptional regulator [Pseudomonadota bacterium]
MPSSPAKIGPQHPDFVLEDYVLYNLVRLSSTYAAEMDAGLKARDLNMTEWRVLSLLKDKNPSTVGELARRSVTKLPTVTRMLDRMEKQQLISRRASSEDGRVVEVRMTARADRTLIEVRAVAQAVFERAFAGISQAEIEQITATLKRVRENLTGPDPRPVEDTWAKAEGGV